MKYLKKPIPIDAWKIDFLELQHQGNYPEWVHNAMQPEYKIFPDYRKCILTIRTLEGDMIAHEGDYLMKGIKGEYYSCKKEIFEESYEEYNEHPIHYKGGDIYNVRVVDNPDGSANVIMDMDDDMKNFFAAEGMKKVLLDAINAYVDEHGVK